MHTQRVQDIDAITSVTSSSASGIIVVLVLPDYGFVVGGIPEVAAGGRISVVSIHKVTGREKPVGIFACI